MTEYNAENDALEGEMRSALQGRSASSNCPPEASWLALLMEELGGEEARALRRHLGECSACAAVAADARRFIVAMEVPKSQAPHSRPRRWAIGSIAAAAALAVIALAVGLVRGHGSRPGADTLAEFVASFKVPALPASEGGSTSSELVYRGAVSSESSAAFAAALTSYRARQFADACSALAEHGQRFPGDREARFLAAAACIKAGELDRSEAILASLAAVAGERRDDARGLLDRLRAARRTGAR